MKKYLFLIIAGFVLVLVLVSNMHKQIHGAFLYVENASELPFTVDCRLSFYSKNKYNLNITIGSAELWHEQFLSSGTYRVWFGRHIFLRDKNGLRMHFLMKGETIIGKQAFCGLVGKTMKAFPYPIAIYHRQMEQVNDGLETSHVEKLPDSYGSQYDFWLVLNDNNEYTYSAYGFVISEGKWERKGNLLYFFDRCLQKPFVGTIKTDRLELFGDEIGVLP